MPAAVLAATAAQSCSTDRGRITQVATCSRGPAISCEKTRRSVSSVSTDSGPSSADSCVAMDVAMSGYLAGRAYVGEDAAVSCEIRVSCAGSAYRNDARDVDSCFLEFDGGARLAILRSGRLDLVDSAAGGHPVLDGPRRTGDGYYVSVVLDPDGNRVEVTTWRGHPCEALRSAGVRL